MLYTLYAPILYGFIKRSVVVTELATTTLHSIFATACREVDTVLTESTNVFIWLLNITRRLLYANSEEHTSFTMPYELVLYNGMNCQQAANAMHQTQNEVKKDLFTAFQKSKHRSK